MAFVAFGGLGLDLLVVGYLVGFVYGWYGFCCWFCLDLRVDCACLACFWLWVTLIFVVVVGLLDLLYAMF